MRERHSSHGAPDPDPARAPSLLIAGAATWDLVDEQRRPGGALVYGARAAAALGVRAQLLTIAGADTDLEALHGHDVTIAEASHTLTLAHTFSADDAGTRRLRLLARPERALSASDLPPSHAPGDALDLLVLAPLLADDSRPRLVRRGTGAAARPARARPAARDRRGRLITHATEPPPGLRDAIDGRTSVFLSEDEIARWDADALHALAGAAERVVVTRGARGATVLRGGERIETPARPAAAVDSTGCGDVFAVAFMIALARGADDARAARIGAELASAALGQRGPQPLPAVCTAIDAASPTVIRAGA